MRNPRIHICPEAIFIARQFLPERDRLFIGKGKAGDRLDRFETIFPRHNKTDRCAILVWQRLAIDAGRQKGQFVLRLFDGQPLDIGPWIPDLFLARGHIRIEEGFHAQIFRTGQRLCHLHQIGQRHARPGHSHGPGLDTAMPVEPFLKPAHCRYQLFGIQRHRRFDHTVDGHHPRICHQIAGLFPDVL